MKRTVRIALLVMLTAGMFYLPGITTPEVSAQAKQDFLLVNKTGIEINALYVTPHNSKEWGDDILGADTLAKNADIDIVFRPKEKAKFWDLRIEDEDGNFIEWDSLNLTEISSVTLYYKNGKATAIFDDFAPDLTGNWAGYYDDGGRSPYVWSIRQTGSTLSIMDARKGGTTKSRGTLQGNKVRALDFATQNGKLSADGTRITWSDGVVWVKQ